MSLCRFVILLFFAFNVYAVSYNNVQILKRNKARREYKGRMLVNERHARRSFFTSYRMMQSDVDMLKRRDAKYQAKLPKKQRVIQIGAYGYIDIPSFLKFFGKAGGVTLVPKDDKKLSELSPILLGGAVLDINFSKHTGLSTIFAYSIFKKTQENGVVAFESGYTGILLFKFSGLPLPFSVVTDFLPNFLDPIYWILYITGLYYKTELLAGVKISFWSEVTPGKFGFNVTDNTFSKLKKFFETRASRTVSESLVTLINEHFFSERRVYVTRHVFYSLNTMLLVPIFISFLQYGCNRTFDWLKKNYMNFFLNVTLGVVI